MCVCFMSSATASSETRETCISQPDCNVSILSVSGVLLGVVSLVISDTYCNRKIYS